MATPKPRLDDLRDAALVGSVISSWAESVNADEALALPAVQP